MVTQSPASPGIERFKPPRVFMMCLTGGIVVQYCLHALLPQFDLLAGVPWILRLSAGLAVATGGFGFMMWGHNRFRLVGTTVKTCLPAKTLVTGAAYHYSRNPMYVGFVAILLGLGLAADSLPMLLSAVAMFLFLDRYVIVREECYLQQRFAADYDSYCHSVRRWL